MRPTSSFAPQRELLLVRLVIHRTLLPQPPPPPPTPLTLTIKKIVAKHIVKKLEVLFDDDFEIINTPPPPLVSCICPLPAQRRER